MKTWIIAVIVVFSIGCKSQLQKQYEHAANELNAILIDLKPTAQKFRAAVAKGAQREIISECYAFDISLSRFAALDLVFDLVRAPHGEHGVTGISGGFTGFRNNVCEDFQRCDHGDCTVPKEYPDHPISLKAEMRSCALYCKTFLIPLLDSAEALRLRAKAEGVDIVSLLDP
jgi:hypothetical protein